MTIPQIKQQLSILSVLEYYGLELDKNNRLHCPFHDDKTPSMQIYPKSNSYCCFSSNCDAGTGDVIQFIQLMEHLAGGQCTKHQAILKAKEILGSPLDKLPQLAFGKDGKPFYVSGPYAQPQQIIQTLERSVGKGNYDYLIQAGPDMDML